MKKKAVFAGSFDPFTKGHEDILLRALPLFDEVIVAIGYNASKQYMFSIDKRIKHIEKIFQKYDQVKVDQYNELTVGYCIKNDAHYIIRGIRNSTDLEFEKSICQMNKEIEPRVETIFIMTAPELSAINSTIVRDIHRHQRDISKFVSEAQILIS